MNLWVKLVVLYMSIGIATTVVSALVESFEGATSVAFWFAALGFATIAVYGMFRALSNTLKK